MTKESCETCLYYYKKLGVYSQCRRYPPVTDPTDPTGGSKFPHIPLKQAGSIKCGEFRFDMEIYDDKR